MNMGLDFSEILVIIVLVLVFFGSKEVPNMIRQTGRFIGKIRMYTDKVKKEIEEIAKIAEPMPSYDEEIINKKQILRKKYIQKRKSLSEEERKQKSYTICEHIKKDKLFINAKSVMAYIETPSEVIMSNFILEMFSMGKRVILPYLLEDFSLGISEITNLDKDISKSIYGVYEPVKELRKNFFKSDLQFIICPGVAFDIYGGRLGRGKGCYDKFLKELKGNVPIYGVSFACQIMGEDERLPFAYHDIIMDQVITENGPLIPKPNEIETDNNNPKIPYAG
jgi:5-formyltetrahydrofolate cyclo-ligase